MLGQRKRELELELLYTKGNRELVEMEGRTSRPSREWGKEVTQECRRSTSSACSKNPNKYRENVEEKETNKQTKQQRKRKQKENKDRRNANISTQESPLITTPLLNVFYAFLCIQQFPCSQDPEVSMFTKSRSFRVHRTQKFPCSQDPQVSVFTKSRSFRVNKIQKFP
jgi:hypothetical protein